MKSVDLMFNLSSSSFSPESSNDNSVWVIYSEFESSNFPTSPNFNITIQVAKIGILNVN